MYAADTNLPAGKIHLTFTYKTGEPLTCTLPSLKSYTSTEDYGERKYFTDEAPERSWHTSAACLLNLPKGFAELNAKFNDEHTKDLKIKGIQVSLVSKS
ncbi:hypothetical protein [Catenovulum sediminis]|uniref:Uncharacterized protein n=1 Tax=Catenovulum sediminis TaxID=1740262 RepID=A0ABV1RC80_9ALTE